LTTSKFPIARRLRLRPMVVAGFAAALVAAGCSSGGAAGSAGTGSDDAPGAGTREGPFSGRVDIGHGRKMFIECRGTGSPTVVLISGKGNGARDGWGEVLDPADPVRRSPIDLVAVGKGELSQSASAVFPSVAKFTRVCAYSRPGTGLDGPQTSTPVSQPHQVEDAVADLRAALDAVGESTQPQVLVAHSYGGLIARLYVSDFAQDVSGLVLDDAVSEFMQTTTTSEQFANWDTLNSTTDGKAEAVQLAKAIERIRATPAMRDLPAVVLSADKAWDPRALRAQTKQFGPGPTFEDWLAAQDLLAKFIDARHITNTNSGHNIEVYQPRLVTSAIRQVVDEVRGP
jgi:pimeloyl-ACP methyl ester carboxylesterase